ncbi:MAG: DNA-processing protein DprA [Dehalococcoidia bacterium]|nr:DNA-processing protein DprA [Dehalococcoidia bacterium]
MIFVRGVLGPQFEQAVAVVGTRHVTPYGRQAAEHFCTVLACSGVTIISGLARGVDAIAHRVALENAPHRRSPGRRDRPGLPTRECRTGGANRRAGVSGQRVPGGDRRGATTSPAKPDPFGAGEGRAFGGGG